MSSEVSPNLKRFHVYDELDSRLSRERRLEQRREASKE
jgi:hypothetical protein